MQEAQTTATATQARPGEDIILDTLEKDYPKIVSVLRRDWHYMKGVIAETEYEYVTKMLKSKVESATEKVVSVFDKGQARAAMAQVMTGAEKITMQPTGFPKLDMLLGGGYAPGVTMIGGLSSLGKTAFAVQCAIQTAEAGTPVCFISLEMSQANIVARIGSHLTARVSSIVSACTTKDYLTYDPDEPHNEDSRQYWMEQANAIIPENLFVYDREMIGGNDIDTITGWIRNFIEYAKGRGLPDPVVYVDYLQYIKAPDSMAGQQERLIVNFCMTQLQQLAQTRKIAVVVLSSLNRANYNVSINNAAFKESGDVEYYAENILGLQYKGLGEKDFSLDAASCAEPRKIQAVILKNRLGTGIGHRVNFDFYAAANTWKEINYEKAKAPAPSSDD